MECCSSDDNTEATCLWNITDASMIKQINNANNGHEFKSEIFEIGSLKWQIIIYPNGFNKDNIDNFDVFTDLLHIPQECQEVTILWQAECPQIQSAETKRITYKQGKMTTSWPNSPIPFKNLNFTHYSFTIMIRILKITLKDNNKVLYQWPLWLDYNGTFTYEINETVMDTLRGSYNGRTVYSPIYNNIWVIEVNPNGFDKQDEGDFTIAIKLCVLPEPFSQIKAIWIVNIKQLNFKTNIQYDFSYNQSGYYMIVGSFEEFKKVEHLTIEMSMEVIETHQIIEPVAESWSYYVLVIPLLAIPICILFRSKQGNKGNGNGNGVT